MTQTPKAMAVACCPEGLGQSETIASAWFSRPATDVAPDLIGCHLVRRHPNGEVVRGMIVETEAYGPDDPACHAYRRRTPRNAVMFGPAGITYIYLIYGMYCCLNVVTDSTDVPSAVLIRALQLQSVAPIPDVIPNPTLDRIAAGPGKLCRVLDINCSLSGQPFQPGQALWLESRSPIFQQALNQHRHKLVQTTRIGISQAADYPWRWYLHNCPSISKP